jgi:ABC-type transport system substrate-binding protein
VRAYSTRVDGLFSRQARILDPQERKRLVNEIEKIVLENAYYMPGRGGRVSSCTDVRPAED